MFSASSSIDTPDLMRRTFAWLNTSLLKGMSRDWLSVIFWVDFAISVSPRRAAESLSLDLLTRHEGKRRPLPLEGGAENRKAGKAGRRSRARKVGPGTSGHAVKQLLRPRLQFEPGVLAGLIAGNCSDALYKIEDAFGLAAFLGEHCLYYLPCLRLA